MRRHSSPLDGHNPYLDRWLLTYADMITLLTVFFLLLYSMSVVSRGKFSQLATSVRSGFGGIATGGPHILNGGGAHTRQTGPTPELGKEEAHRQYQQSMENLRQYVEQKQLKTKVTMREDERGVVISLLSDDMLFDRGQADLTAGSAPLLRRIATTLRSVPNPILIEGHTCDLPIHSAQYPSNWELSAARAGRVLRYFTEQLRLPNRRFTAAGYAETRPLVPNTTEVNRARNRRVDIVILKTSAQQQAELLRQSEIRRISAQKSSLPIGSALPA